MFSVDTDFELLSMRVRSLFMMFLMIFVPSKISNRYELKPGSFKMRS